MPKAAVDGLAVVYEIVGDAGGRLWVLTPGGRYSKDTPGLRELANAMAELGERVLIWDRPNTGESDVCFKGESESTMHADVLAGLLLELGLPKAIVAGGSAGARTALLVAARHPEVVAGIGTWWVSGGVYGLMMLGVHYCRGSLVAAWNGDMNAVADLPEWAEVIGRNPDNRARLLAQDPEEFVATMERWMAVYYPREGEIVPGLTTLAAAHLDVPAVIVRSGAADMNHPRVTQERLAALLPRARLVAGPWPETEWVDRMHRGEVGFPRWPLLAPILHQWAEKAFLA